MTWIKLDDEFHANPKIVAVGNAGAGLYVRALSYCGAYLTDGFIGHEWAKEKGSARLVRSVTEAKLWLRVEGGEVFRYQTDEGLYAVTIPSPGYYIEDYLLLNPTREQIEAKRSDLSQKRSAAGKLGAQSRWQPDGKQNGKRDGKRYGNGVAEGVATVRQTDGPVPVPTPKEQKTEQSLRPRDELWDAMVAELRTEPSTKSERGRWNKAISEIREAGATATDVKRRANEYRKRWPGMSLTPTALSTHWGSLSPKTTLSVACPECGVGAGLHAEDCAAVAPMSRTDMEEIGARLREHRQ